MHARAAVIDPKKVTQRPLSASHMKVSFVV